MIQTRKQKVLMIVDKLAWSYDSIARGIAKHNSNANLLFDIVPVNEGLDYIERNHASYDLVFAIGWTLIISKNKKDNYREMLPFLDRKRLITGIHSHRSWDKYLSLPDMSPAPPVGLLEKLSRIKNINVISRRLYKIFKDAGLRNIALTENGVDTDLFKPASPINTDRKIPLVLGFSGSTSIPKHDYLKGLSEFILPLREIPNVEVKVLGGRGEHQVPREEMPRLYDQIDLYVCASTSEGFSQSVLEASSCGRGIISTKVGGCEDLIDENQNGFLVKRDLGEIKKRIIQLEADRSLVKRLGENNRRKVLEKYSWRIRVKDWLTFIESNLPADIDGPIDMHRTMTLPRDSAGGKSPGIQPYPDMNILGKSNANRGGRMTTKRVLLTGHFSTVGDIESLDIIRHWLDEIGVSYDVAPFSESVRAKMPEAVHFARVEPGAYSHLVTICGPVWKEQLEKLQFDLSRFQHCMLIGINLTLVAPLNNWNPFDVLLERDSNRLTRPDLTLLADTGSVPVVGRCMVRKQASYAGRERHDQAQQLFNDLIRRRDFAAIDLDTRWYLAENGLRTPSHFLSALQRIDLLFTNRLHGMIYALKAGVPVVAIDAIEGGAKVYAQAKAIGWPQCILIETATPERIDAAVDWCLSPEARQVALSCRKKALSALHEVKREFLAALTPRVTQSRLPGRFVSNNAAQFK